MAVLNNGGGFYGREFYLHEARMKGATIVPPCVNQSQNEATISGKEIMLGFGFLHGLEDETAYTIVKAREREGAFADLDDFLDRVPIGVEQIDILIRINAFRFTGQHKRALLWEARFKMDPRKYLHTEQADLFKEPRKSYQLPALERSHGEEAFDQIELLGFPLVDPFALVSDMPVSVTFARELPKLIGKVVEVYGYLVTRRTTTTSRGDAMAFGNFTDVEGAFLDTVHFPQAIRQYPFRGRGVYRVVGKVCEEFDCISIEANFMEKLDLIPDPRYAEGPLAT